MRKTVISILLALLLCASMLPAAARADGGEFVFDAETGTITGYTDNKVTELVIPAEIDGVAVKEIGAHAFKRCYHLSSITISEGITTIGELAFFKINVKSVTIPSSVTAIGRYAFSDCKNLESVTVPEGVVSLGDHAFFNCRSLKSVTLPESVTSIGESAFSRCEELKSITIKGGVATIGSYAFEDCTHLTEINVAKNNAVYVSDDGVLYTKDMKTLVCCPSGRSGELVIPNGVKTIGQSAFASCKRLTEVKIPKSVD